MKTRFSIAERTAIGELVEMAQLLAGKDGKPDKRNRMLGALFCECAANVIRGERAPQTWTNKDVREFAAFWKTDERAKFNPKPRRRKS